MIRRVRGRVSEGVMCVVGHGLRLLSLTVNGRPVAELDLASLNMIEVRGHFPVACILLDGTIHLRPADKRATEFEALVADANDPAWDLKWYEMYETALEAARAART